MPRAKMEIVNELGFHLRAAGKFAEKARSYDAKIEVRCRGSSAEGTDVTGLLSLGCSKGSTIEISAEGPDADEALSALSELVSGGFGEKS